jgi:hypothetical protein
MEKRSGPSASYWRIQAGIMFVGCLIALGTGHYWVALILLGIGAVVYAQIYFAR